MIYLCGPMSGLPEFNFPTFQKVTAHLRESGLEVICPTEINTPEDGRTHEQCMVRDIEQMMRHCDTIAYLPGWERSKGATLEMMLAERLNYRFVDVRTTDPVMLRFDYAPVPGTILMKFLKMHYDSQLTALVQGKGVIGLA